MGLLQGGAVLLLTGPSGCGKTATVRVLAKDVRYHIQEWTNPTTAEYKTDDSFRERFDPGVGKVLRAPGLRVTVCVLSGL